MALSLLLPEPPHAPSPTPSAITSTTTAIRRSTILALWQRWEMARLRPRYGLPVKLATFTPPESYAPLAGEVRGDEAIAFDDGASVRDRLSANELSPAEGERWPLHAVTLQAPIPDPGAIYGIGLNYAAHAVETGGERPERPIVFTKVPGAVAPPGGPVRRPAAVRRLDYEGELAVVIGAGGRAGGFAVADDVSARDLQKREPQ